MKKILTLIAVFGILSSAATMAQSSFPSDPGTLKVDLILSALTTEGDSLPEAYAPGGSGAYDAGHILTITAQDIPGYTFAYWDDQVTDPTRQITINESMSLAALYTQDSYYIEFLNADSTVLFEGEYTYGSIIPEVEVPSIDATDQYTFTFKGWNPAVEMVTGPQTYIAQYDTTTNTYAIQFIDWNYTQLQLDTLEYGAMPQYRGETPTREITEGVQYTFTGWEPEIAAVTGDATYTAKYTDQLLEYNVIIIINGEQETQRVVHGNSINLSAPDTESHHFVGWSDGYSDWTRTAIITSDTTFTALYEINTYAVRFYDWDDSLLQLDTLQYGAMPQYRGETPTRATAEGIQYTFRGWEPEITEVKAEAQYSAKYDELTLEYTITVNGGSASVPTATYGTSVTITATPSNVDEHFISWNDGDTNETRQIIVVSDTTFTATFGSSYVDVNVQANQWTYFCLPQTTSGDGWSSEMFIVSELDNVAWGTYNGDTRAQGRSGWETPETYQSTKGYIIYSSTTGRLRLNIYPENLNSRSTTVQLQAYEATYPENAGWNFVGNPYYTAVSASSISVSGTTEPTATIWNGTAYSNELLDTEGLTFQPLQAFFIQTNGAGTLSFAGSANGSDNPPSPDGGAPKRAPKVEDNSRIDIHATADGYTDKTRVIFRSNSSVKYEAGRDASKFMTATAPVQLYFLDVDNIQCAQMVRPAGEDNMRLGFMVRKAGNIEINMPYYAEGYEMYDALTDRSYALDEPLSIYSEAGTYNNRLSIRPIRKVATGTENAGAEISTAKIMLNGQLYIIRDGKMYTIQGNEVK